MSSRAKRTGLAALLTIILLGMVTVIVRPYEGKLTALFHMDDLLANQHTMPAGFVVLDIPSYDGAQYWQIARSIPKIFTPAAWPELSELSPGPYAYQRSLLPFTAFLLAGGRDALLPYTFLLIQLLSLVGSFLLIARRGTHTWLYGLALALSPAAMVGLHFSLAEPLTILLITAFLAHTHGKLRLTPLDLILLSLLVLTREVNILFVGLFFLFLLWQRRWRDVLLLVIPGVVFVGWHSVLWGIFHTIPFLWSAEKNTWPFGAIIELLLGGQGYSKFTFSSIALFFLFVLPAIIWVLDHIIRKKERSFEALATLAFLVLMTIMPDHIWGSITSIGRVITPVYPLFLFTALQKNTWPVRSITIAILLLGLAAGLGLALTVHPFHLTP